MELWQIAVTILTAGVSYGALWMNVAQLSKRVGGMDAAYTKEFSQVWQELKQEETAMAKATEELLVRMAKLEVTLERLDRWVDKNGG